MRHLQSEPAQSVDQSGDIRDYKHFGSAELIVGCYPCQGYTQGGKRDWKGDQRNYLYREFDRILRAIRPRAFVVWNVNGMLFGENRKLLENQLTRYRTAGYRVKWCVLNAKHYGVPQNRCRVFLVGIRPDQQWEFEFPKPTHGPRTGKRYASQLSAIGACRRGRTANPMRVVPLVLHVATSSTPLGKTQSLHRRALETRPVASFEPALASGEYRPLGVHQERKGEATFVS